MEPDPKFLVSYSNPATYHTDVSSWYESSPKLRRRIHFWSATRSRQNTVMISSFFGSDKCSLCGRKRSASGRSRAAVCLDCRKDPTKAVEAAMRNLNVAQQNSLSLLPGNAVAAIFHLRMLYHFCRCAPCQGEYCDLILCHAHHIVGCSRYSAFQLRMH